MSYKKRISAILLASALSVGLLAGCGGNSDSGSASGDSVEITNVSYDPRAVPAVQQSIRTALEAKDGSER